MAFLTGYSFEATDDDVIDVITSGYAWNLDSSRTISWAVANGRSGEVWPDPDLITARLTEAFASFKQFLNVQFEFVGFVDDVTTAATSGSDITVSIDNANLPGGAPYLGYASYPHPFPGYTESYSGELGDIFINTNASGVGDLSFPVGSDDSDTLIHEISHALGLKHPFEDEGGSRPTIQGLGRDDLRDIDWFVVTSYTDDNASVKEKWDPGSPMLLDILGLQYLYEANQSANLGDTEYVLADREYYYSLYDAGGIDVVDASSLSEGWYIELPDTQLTSLVNTSHGYAVPLAQRNASPFSPTELVWLLGDIEDATGTQFDDDLYGSSLENILRGGNGADYMSGRAGNDTLEGGNGNDTLSGGADDDMLDGGAGVDTAAYDGNQNSFTLTLSPNSMVLSDRRTDGRGMDTLQDIEFLDFDTDLLGNPFDLTQFTGLSGVSGSDLESFVELYIAYFNRAPDAVGLNFWGNAFASGEVGLADMAELFFDQPETRSVYVAALNEDGSQITDVTAFVTAIYTNVLGRSPDAGGRDFWVSVLEQGEVTPGAAIGRIIEGAKADAPSDATQAEIDARALDQQYLANATDIGVHFAVINGMSDTTNASAVMDILTRSSDSVNAAFAQSNQLLADAQAATGGEFLMPLVGVIDNPFVG